MKDLDKIFEMAKKLILSLESDEDLDLWFQGMYLAQNIMDAKRRERDHLK